MSYLGLDIGTSGCKAVVFSETGKELASAYREYKVLTPALGQAELDSGEVCEKCFDVIREAARGNDPVQAMAISSQGEAFTVVNDKNEIISKAMVSSDCRAAGLLNDLDSIVSRERLYQITGHTAHTIFSLYKLMWIRKNNPELWNPNHRYLCFEDLLHLKLGIQPAISWPLAGRTMLFDVMRHEWSREILEAIGLKKEQLAQPMASGSVAGIIPGPVAALLGLPQGVKVVTGGHDQACAALGAGAVSHGIASYATGTVECVCPALSAPQFSPELYANNLCCYDYTVKGMYTTVAYSLTGGNILKWFRDELGPGSYDSLLESMPDEPTALMTLPYFTPTGTPYFDTETAGAILGLRLTTKKDEILKSLLEGVAFEMRLNVELMEQSGMTIREFRVTGGGSRSLKWSQLKADVLNRPMKIVDLKEAGCFGAACLANMADTGESVQIRNDGTTLIPDPEKSAYYGERFKLYKELYPALKRLRV